MQDPEKKLIDFVQKILDEMEIKFDEQKLLMISALSDSFPEVPRLIKEGRIIAPEFKKH